MSEPDNRRPPERVLLRVAFAVSTNSPPDLNRALERGIKPMAEKLGLPRFSWHDFRHAYTTWGRQAGVGAEVRDGAAEKIGRFVWPEDEEEAA